MTMEPNKFSSCSRGLPEDFKSANHPFDAALLSLTVDPQLPLRHDVSRLLFRGRKKATEDVFQDLLSEANRDLTSLLKDVRAVQEDARLGDTRRWPINELLMRAVRCAAKQYVLQAELGNLALRDELTGLYNRRGFMAIAERQLKVGRRSGRGMLLFFVDVDALKQINDSFGHCEGDRALKRTARALEMTFRDSDVIARLGGDEFAVLAIEASRNSEAAMRSRLSRALKLICERETRYSLHLSLGAARVEVGRKNSMRKLMDRADQAMYEQRRHRSTLSLASMMNDQSV